MNKPVPVHPFLFSTYFVFFLFAHNAAEVPLLYAARGLASFLAVTALLMFLIWFITRDTHKTAIMVAILMISLFAYRPAYDMVQDLVVAGYEVGRHRFAVPLYVCLIMVALALTARSRRDCRPLSRFLNIAGTLLISMAVIQVASGLGSLKQEGDVRTQWAQVIEQQGQIASNHHWKKAGARPDIYYIILDAYARQDILSRYYGYANDRFVQDLRTRGFFIAERSRSNYPVTFLSLPSSLNFDYLDPLVKASAAEKFSYSLAREMITNSKISHILKDQGYKFLFYPSGFTLCASSSNIDIGPERKWQYLSEFEYVLLDSSLLWVLGLSSKSSARLTLQTMEELRHVPRITDPTFTLAHFACPHPPFIFDRNGRCPNAYSMSTASPGQLYLDQLEYVNKLVLQAIDDILAHSDPPPIIVLQSDHGPCSDWCFHESRPSDKVDHEQWVMDMQTGILNAYFLPSAAQEKLYDTISPVNTFRLILNECFAAEYEMLPDQVYFPSGAPRRGQHIGEALNSLIYRPELEDKDIDSAESAE